MEITVSCHTIRAVESRRAWKLCVVAGALWAVVSSMAKATFNLASKVSVGTSWTGKRHGTA